MGGIKDLVGLLFWMDNDALPTMKAVSHDQRKLSRQKRDIISFVKKESDSSNLRDKAVKPGAGPKCFEDE